jgi:hypothetical protein
MKCTVKRTLVESSRVLEQDIVDVAEVRFRDITLCETDQVVCLFRHDWRFGLAFDMNPMEMLDADAFSIMLGTLYRSMRYRHILEALQNNSIPDRLLEAGWFPFADIVTEELNELIVCCDRGSDFREVEDRIVTNYDQQRFEHMLQRWMAKPHFQDKKQILSPAIDAFIRREPVAVIKIILTEIEGVLLQAYRTAHNGQGAKLDLLLDYLEHAAHSNAAQPHSLLFPDQFSKYIRHHTFANFHPDAADVAADSRHAVGHGAANQESYTMVRALQAILTLDQIAFFT